MPSPVPTPSFVPLPVTPGPGLSCADPDAGYRLTYPRDWWPHPADASRGIDPCSYFGPEQFELVCNPDEGRLVGESVRVQVMTVCGVGYPYGTEFPTREDVQVGGFPRRERVKDPFLGDYYQYVVNLEPGVSEEDCVEGRWFAILVTYQMYAADYAAGRDAVDLMAATIDFD
jgi:hypothetical protein